jgi:hypothetical protein
MIKFQRINIKFLLTSILRDLLGEFSGTRISEVGNDASPMLAFELCVFCFLKKLSIIFGFPVTYK